MYSEKVMDHFNNPRNVGELEQPSGVGTLARASPSSASITALFVTSSACWTVFPFTSSVAMLLVATAAPQPKVLNFAS